MSELRALSGQPFQSFGTKCEKAVSPFVGFNMLGAISSPNFCGLKKLDGLQCNTRSVRRDVKCFPSVNVIFIITNYSCKTGIILAMTYRVSHVVSYEQKLYDIS